MYFERYRSLASPTQTREKLSMGHKVSRTHFFSLWYIFTNTSRPVSSSVPISSSRQRETPTHPIPVRLYDQSKAGQRTYQTIHPHRTRTSSSLLPLPPPPPLSLQKHLTNTHSHPSPCPNTSRNGNTASAPDPSSQAPTSAQHTSTHPSHA